MKFHKLSIWLSWCLLTLWSPINANGDNVKPELKTSNNFKSSLQNSNTISSNNEILYETCSAEDFSCLSTAANDKAGLEAIISLHKKLDDDENGNVDLSESDDFLREELKYDSGYEKRQKAFHRNDNHISAKELWDAWLKSEVHNWTVEQTTEWLTSSVGLPQYILNFVQNKVTGIHLPRMAVNNNYLSSIGIKDPIHKQKISLKAMDVVLFGPPKDGQYWKDVILIALVISLGVGFWYGVQQNKKFKEHLNRMNKDMDSLQNAEKALQSLQQELVEKESREKKNLEKNTDDSETLSNSCSDLEISQLKAEIAMLRTELQIAEGELKDRCWAPPLALQQWLQLTYEVENRSYVKKKVIAEKQLQQAREACEKLRKKRSSLIGAFVSTHGKSIDEVDRSIVEARTALNEVTQELQERVQRWKQIEQLCGFSIMNNNGFQYLESALYRNGRSLGSKGRLNSADDLDDDTGSIYAGHQGCADPSNDQSWREDPSSESDLSKQEDDSSFKSRSSNQNNVKFVLGDDSAPSQDNALNSKISRVSMIPRAASSGNNSTTAKNAASMKKSYSHDVNLSLLPSVPKSVEFEFASSTDSLAQKSMQTKEQSSASLEDDICSTDSSLLEEELKRRKRKFFNLKKKK
ncbi:stromal interaction molecule homolog isoform X2 [Coccinella septempunctata]|uniref:stromal interaction molecule homolog isoform X2 n=1 Tax=Coccinella septempunctata TaxID=41139 RepID=UPI001D08F8A3|nr:stromal interaction molecule homolog isoform X2 [Coccinella septempunctata]